MTPTRDTRGRLRVLVVDDEPRLVRLIRLTLAPDRFEVLPAPDGLAGVELVETEWPDLVLDLLAQARSERALLGQRELSELLDRAAGQAETDRRRLGDRDQGDARCSRRGWYAGVGPRTSWAGPSWLCSSSCIRAVAHSTEHPTRVAAT